MPLVINKDLKEKHTIRSIRKLEQQVLDNAMIAHRCAMLTAQLSDINSIDISFRESLHFCLYAMGISKGAIAFSKASSENS